MKKIAIVLVAVGLLAVGSLLVLIRSHNASGTHTSPPPESKATAVSNGDFTFYLGTTTINGTNMPASNIVVKVMTDEAPK